MNFTSPLSLYVLFIYEYLFSMLKAFKHFDNKFFFLLYKFNHLFLIISSDELYNIYSKSASKPFTTKWVLPHILGVSIHYL